MLQQKRDLRSLFTENAEQFDALMTEMLDENHKLQQLYDELLYAVETVVPGESRHETALRYIRQAESRRTVAATDDATWNEGNVWFQGNAVPRIVQRTYLEGYDSPHGPNPGGEFADVFERGQIARRRDDSAEGGF